jgi:hypothetical protein
VTVVALVACLPLGVGGCGDAVATSGLPGGQARSERRGTASARGEEGEIVAAAVRGRRRLQMWMAFDDVGISLTK